MSKLIVEMEMPKCCWDCACCDSEYRYCAAGKKPRDDLNERPSWCPIKGVLPDEHGDLIDRDELRKMNVFSQEFNRYVVPMMYIEDANPIVAAERKDE